MNLQKKKVLSHTSRNTPSQIDIDLKSFFGKSPICLDKARRIILNAKNPEEVVKSIYSFCTQNDINPSNIPESFLPLIIKLISVVSYSLDTLIPDSRIPEKMKPYLSNGNIVSFLSIVFKKTSTEPFNNGRVLLSRYNKLVEEIQDCLIKKQDYKALEFKPRKEFLFDWCRVLIELTSHPLLLDKLQDQDYRVENKKKLDQLFATLSKFVLFIVIVDDVADIMQDRKLLSFFTSVPNLTKETLLKEVSRMESEGYSHFVEFFKFCHEVWLETIKEVNTFIDEEIFGSSLEQEIKQSIQKVMKSMLLSVAINDTSGLYEGSYESVEKTLAVNMLMTFFKVIESAFLKEQGEIFSAKLKEILQKIFSTGEIIGHSGNNVATFMREIRNGDISNTLILIIDAKLKVELDLRGINFNQYIASVLDKEKISIPEATDFLGFTTECSKSNQKIFKLATELCKKFQLDFNTFIREVSEIDDLESIDRLVSERMDLSSANEFTMLVSELKMKASILKIVKLILEDPKLNALGSYYERINGDFNKIKTLSDEAGVKGLNLYIDGVYNLFVMYLLFKSDM